MESPSNRSGIIICNRRLTVGGVVLRCDGHADISDLLLTVAEVKSPADDVAGVVLGLDVEHVVVVWTDAQHRQPVFGQTQNHRRRAAGRCLLFHVPVATCASECQRRQNLTAGFIMDARSASVHVIFYRCFFYLFFMSALIGQTAQRIFTKLSHVVDIRCYL